MPSRVSVVITNHNYGQFVGDAIASALEQVGPTPEVIVVDDGSSDGSREAIARFGDRVRAIFTENNGQGAAFNVGWAASHGDIVMFLDADDVLDRHTCAAVCRAFGDDPSLARVQFPLRVIDSDGRPTGAVIPERERQLFAGDARARLLTCPDDIVWQPTSGNAFAARALAAVMPVPEAPYRICADYYLSNLTPLHGGVSVLAGVGGGYRVHGANLHFATTETLQHLRDNVCRTRVTHQQLIAHCRRLGLKGLGDDPDEVRSVTAAANRLISYRFDPAAHPITDDNRRRLAVLGTRSALARVDVDLPRRLAMASWFIVVATVPRRWLRNVLRPFVAIDVASVTHTRGTDR